MMARARNIRTKEVFVEFARPIGPLNIDMANRYEERMKTMIKRRDDMMAKKDHHERYGEAYRAYL